MQAFENEKWDEVIRQFELSAKWKDEHPGQSLSRQRREHLKSAVQ
ncbi:MAG: hypothetical protein R3E01_05995 [Pirellulaceae bacterium]